MKQRLYQKQPPPPRGNQDGFGEMLHLPPGSLFTLSIVGATVGVLANLWQAFTTFSAFQHLFLDGSVFQALSKNAQAAAIPIITIVSGLIAVSFQISILFLVFRVGQTWKERKVYGTGMNAIRGMAVEVAHQVPLILVWSGFGFLADTVGDYTFLSLYTDNGFVLFMYGATLYASSTIMLAAAQEYYWSAKVAYAKWSAFQRVLQMEAERLASMRRGKPKP